VSTSMLQGCVAVVNALTGVNIYGVFCAVPCHAQRLGCTACPCGQACPADHTLWQSNAPKHTAACTDALGLP
jgi:hypothetical protein